MLEVGAQPTERDMRGTVRTSARAGAAGEAGARQKGEDESSAERYPGTPPGVLSHFPLPLEDGLAVRRAARDANLRAWHTKSKCYEFGLRLTPPSNRVTVGNMNVGSGGRPYAQVARAAAQNRTRTALLDAADEAFFAGSWEQTSLTEIAVAAGVTKQTLLRHFGSKDGLAVQAATRGQAKVRDQRWSAPTDDVPGAVDNLLDHYDEFGGRALKIASGLASLGGGEMKDIGRTARQLHYDWVDHAFGAWLRGTRGKTRARQRAALIALCDVQTWWLLSHDLELARPEVRATLILAIERLLEGEK
jgi:AcrR family transcriptional regulator